MKLEQKGVSMFIKKLVIENFKGIKQKTIDFTGNMKISGDNATGKTTIMDAWLWLLSEKDSTDSKQFQWKPVDSNNNEIHNLETYVEAVINHNDEEITLKRMIAEKWTRPRGSKVKEFSGHTSEFEIDSKVVQKKDFEKFIVDMIADAEQFKMFSNALYFNESVSWQNRRDMLMKISGEITDDQIFEENNFISLQKSAGKHSIDEYRDMLTTNRRKLNDKLKTIPARIDEATKALPEPIDINEQEKTSLNAKAEKIKGKIEAAKNGQGAIDIKKQIRDNEEKINVIKSQINARIQQLEKHHSDSLHNIDQEISTSLRELRKLESERDEIVNRNKKQLDLKNSLTTDLENLRLDYKTITSEEYHQSENCPTCKQRLPENLIDESKALFNSQKAKRIENNMSNGKNVKAQLENIKLESLVEITEKVESANERHEALKKQLKDKMDSWKAPQIDTPAELNLLNANIEMLKNKLSAIDSGAESDVSEYNAEMLMIQKKLDEFTSAEAINKEHARILNRIKELEQEEKDIVNQLEECEHMINEAERFVRLKVSAIENKVNRLFKICKFKMFENQINGGLKEICECTVNGVPYNALNNAARINAGIDIINTFSDHYEMTCPVFIDNAESVVDIAETRGQAIYLVVDGTKKELEIIGA